MTLHLYVPPITRCRVFEPDAGRVIVREPGFHSIGGLLTKKGESEERGAGGGGLGVGAATASRRQA